MIGILGLNLLAILYLVNILRSDKINATQYNRNQRITKLPKLVSGDQNSLRPQSVLSYTRKNAQEYLFASNLYCCKRQYRLLRGILSQLFTGIVVSTDINAEICVGYKSNNSTQ